MQKDRRKKKAENDSSEITYFEEVNVKVKLGKKKVKSSLLKKKVNSEVKQWEKEVINEQCGQYKVLIQSLDFSK